MVSIDWASRHPGEVAACVVLNTSLRPSAPLRAHPPRNYAMLLRVLFERDPRARGPRSSGYQLGRAEGRHRLGLDLLRDRAAHVTRQHLRQLVAAARYRAPRRRLRCRSWCSLRPAIASSTRLLENSREGVEAADRRASHGGPRHRPRRRALDCRRGQALALQFSHPWRQPLALHLGERP